MTMCKPGDLAMITHDVPSCTDNIGRIVKVYGPAWFDSDGHLTWIIEPITPEPYMVNDEDGHFARFMDYGEHGIEHPDCWMMPLRPDCLDEEVVEALKLSEQA